MDKNIWLDGMMGFAVGDALGNPVQFMRREEVRRRGDIHTHLILGIDDGSADTDMAMQMIRSENRQGVRAINK